VHKGACSLLMLHVPALMAACSCGARVMKTQDGAPVTRDATFLAEAGILASASAHKLAAAQQAGSSGSCGGAAGSLRSWLDPAVPITL
jgi:hypothetical protein